MPYHIAFPPLPRPPSSSPPVIAVMDPMVAPLADRSGGHVPQSSPSTPEVSRILAMSLDEFAAGHEALQVRVPWHTESLWFVPSSAVATALSREGISRGRIWTANELRDLMDAGSVTHRELRCLTQIKEVLGTEFVRIRRRPTEDTPPVPAPEPKSHLYIWPTEIRGKGKLTLATFTPCTTCGTGTWAYYGGTPYCVRHARAEVQHERDNHDVR